MARRAVVGLLVLVAGVVLVAAIAGRGTAADRDRILSFLRRDEHEEAVVSTGYLEAAEVAVSAEAGGRVDRVAVSVGDLVEAGDVLVTLVDPDLEARLLQAEAGVESARARLAQLEAGSPTAEADALEAAAEQARRAAQAARQGAASAPPGAREAAEARAAVAEAESRLADARVALARAATGSAARAAAVSAVRQAEARRGLLELQRDRLTVRSPLAGTVTDVVVASGDVPPAGALVARVARMDPLDLVVFVTEDDLDAVDLGAPVVVTVTGDDEDYDGEVVAVAAEAEFTPRNVQTRDARSYLSYAVTVRVGNPDGDLRPGLPADAEIEVE